jgi:RNA polymerase sigma-70 factor (ECF subfamily)
MVADLRPLATRFEALTDEEVVARVLAGETPLFEVLMRRHNQRLFRAARAILREADEAEDVMQDAYVRAFERLAQFSGRARFSTWLTKIAVHEALARARRRRRTAVSSDEVLMTATSPEAGDPGAAAERRELAALLERAIDALPDLYRSVFVLREVEELDTAETADCLELSEEAVKVRLHRARAALRRELERRLGAARASVYEFRAVRCDRVVARVFERIAPRPR